MRPLTSGTQQTTQLTDDANLLFRLKVEEELTWKDIQKRFLDLRRKELKIPAL